MKKKFTFVELVFVLAIIGILMMVIVPKISAMKTSSKMAGVDTNTRVVSAYVQKEISNYSSEDAALLETELANAFDPKDIVNPFTRAEGIKEYSSIGSSGTAVAYATTDNNDKDTVVAMWENNTVAKETLKGGVLVCAYPNPNGTDTLEVTVYPFDQNGKVILSKKVVVQP